MSNTKTMSFVSSAVFWGVIIIIFGFSILLREIFHIHFPFLRVIFGMLLIYWGVKVIAGGFRQNWGNSNIVFNEANISDDGSKRDYNIVFGNGTIDLFKMEMPTSNKSIEVNAVFGSGRLILNDSIPTLVEMNTVFGSVNAPDKSKNAFGSSVYTNSAYKEGLPYLKVEANAVFGSIQIQSNKW